MGTATLTPERHLADSTGMVFIPHKLRERDTIEGYSYAHTLGGSVNAEKQLRQDVLS